MSEVHDEVRWLEMLETIDALVTEIQAQLKALEPGGTPSPHAADISRNLFKVAEVLALVVTSASRQIISMENEESQRTFAASILNRVRRIRKSMEHVNGKLRGIQGMRGLPEELMPVFLN